MERIKMLRFRLKFGQFAKIANMTYHFKATAGSLIGQHALTHPANKLLPLRGFDTQRASGQAFRQAQDRRDLKSS
jgi:hypothetical protein